MLSPALAVRLRDAIEWRPASGDRFVIPNKEMDDEVFHVAEMTIEVHTHHGEAVVKFNGTTEWALDSLPMEDVLWLPREDQLRGALGTQFVALEHQDDEWVVTFHTADGNHRTRDHDVENAYALAVLEAASLDEWPEPAPMN
ncbi:MAG: pilus assembly protein CpaE [Arachnia sp.]